MFYRSLCRVASSEDAIASAVGSKAESPSHVEPDADNAVFNIAVRRAPIVMIAFFTKLQSTHWRIWGAKSRQLMINALLKD